jgi:hypothetical protein
MRIAHGLWALALLALASAPVAAVDLKKIDRTIAKEPAYKSNPKYCLLVFGPEAKMRVWLVLDGDTLYADRNGNGDLTEEGERFLPTQEYLARRGRRVWRVGDVATLGGKVIYKELSVADLVASEDRFQGRGLGVSVKVPLGSTWSFQSAGSLVHPTEGQTLRFAERPEDAPVIHFGGPLRIMLMEPERFTRGVQAGQRYELQARVGTPGLSKDTAAIIDDLHMFSLVNADHGSVGDLEYTDRDGRSQRQHLKLVCD